MNANGMIQIILYLTILLALAVPLGAYMAGIYQDRTPGAARFLKPLEKAVYRACRVDPGEEMSWKAYAVALMAFNFVGFLALYLLQRLQGSLPLNPQGFPGLPPDTSFNTAVSFVTNTNWQSYSGEARMSYLTQMLGLGVQNFVSAASGMAVLVALIRGLVRRTAKTIGNFWADLCRTTVYILLPLSLVLAVLLISQGVIQNFAPYKALQEPAGSLLPQGPAASQIAIKQLGTNGGGFFNANSAHPFENPTPFSNLLELLAILLIPAALCVTFGRMVGDKRQGRAILAVMMVIFIPLAVTCYHLELRGNPGLTGLGVAGGGNMEGKEVRFGIADSALWAAATTAASNGSVNAMHDSFTPLGGLIPMWLMEIGEIVFGGVGSGLYGMLMFVVIAVFISGLMVGRTPEYLGKKIEAFEMKMASLVVLIPACLVLVGTAVAVASPAGASAAVGGPHGFSEILYALSSAANNNGSAFAGLNAASPFYNILLGLVMFIARFWLMVPILAAAGSLAAKKHVPAGAGTLPTDTPLFVAVVVAVILLVGALTFLPALSLGPIAEHMMMGL